MTKNSLETAYRHHHESRYREDFSILEEERGKLFKELIGTDKRVLDIGCRDGILTRHFIEGNNVIGVDIDSHALEKAGTLGIQTVQMDLNADTWPLEENSFDVVVVAEVLEHLFFPERALEKIKRLLKPGGSMIGSVPNAFSLKCRLRYLAAKKNGTPLADPMHINQFGWREFKNLLQAQFAEVTLHPLGRTFWGLRNTMPELFAFGIGFSARKR